MSGEILNFYNYLWDTDDALESAIAYGYDFFRGIDPEIDDPELEQFEAYIRKLEKIQEQIKSEIPQWVKDAAEAEEELLADLEARADALSY